MDYKEMLDKFERSVFKWNKLFIIPVLLIVWMIYAMWTEASEVVYSDSICSTDKCRARVERLNQCKWDLECATKKTLTESEKYIYNDLKNLEELSKWKSDLTSAVDFISWFEGLRLTAYYDWYANGSNRYSIGYGTKSYPWEVITKEEAKKRKMRVLKPLYKSIPACFNENQKTALSSYIYNTWGNQMNLPYHISNCRKKDVEYIMNVYWWNKELIERRKKEILKYKS